MGSSSEVISIHGPVELYGDQLALKIPLEEGGHALAPLARDIGFVEDDCLIVIIKPWLAEKLNITLGSLVYVSNTNGKFTITRSAANDGPR